MKEFIITNSDTDAVFSQLGSCLGVDYKQDWGESSLVYDNDLGKGSVRTISFDWGVSLIDCDLIFTEDVKLIFKTNKVSPIEFIFITKGSFKYSENNTLDFADLEQYQNIIISPKKNSSKTFLFPKGEQLKINFIRIVRKEYLKKKHNNITYLNELLLSLFNDSEGNLEYHHEGSFSLKIADEVKELTKAHDSGMLRTLSIEGRIYLILSLQLLEHHTFEEDKSNLLPESLSKNDIKKIHRLTDYILENIANNITIDILSTESGLSPKKLQLGFKLLYSKTVNEYVRQLKLEISRDYLKNTELSISEIVYAIGIKSRSYFSKIFSENYGILPTDYRKQLKNNKKVL